MKKTYLLIVILASCSLFGFKTTAQTTAMNFTQTDCNGTPQDLFTDLDAGQAVVLFYFMPNCSSCPPPAQEIQAMANKINLMCPNFVKGYAFSYLNSTACTYTSGWVTGNNLPMYAPMDNGEASLAYYGGFGMPTVAVVAGTNHDVLFVTQNYTSADTTTIRDLLLGVSCVAGTSKISATNTAISVFPNPSNGTAVVTINSNTSDEVSIDLLDVFGRTVYSKSNIQLTPGKTEQSIDVSTIPNGNYFIRVKGSVLISTEKLIIAN